MAVSAPLADEPPHSAARNALAMAASQVLGRGFLLVGFVMAGRAAGPEAFGQLNVALGFLTMLSLVADPGLHYVGQRALVAHPDEGKHTIATVTGLKLALAMAVVVCVGLVHLVLRTTVSFLTLCYAASLLPAAVGLGWALGGRERFGAVAWANLLSAFVHATWIVAFVRAPADVWQVAVGLFFANLVAAVVQLVLLPSSWRGRPYFTARWHEAGALLRQGVPFAGLLALSQLLVWLDSFLLAALLDTRAVGVYHAAYRWVLLTLAVSTYFPQALFPRMLRLRQSELGKRLIREAIRLGLLLGPIASLVLLVAAPFLVKRGFGEAYAGAEQTLVILCTLIPFAMHNGLAIHHLNACGREAASVRIAAVVVVANAVFNVILIRACGVRGAAVAMVATEILSAFLCALALRQVGVAMGKIYGGFWVAGVVAAIVSELPPWGHFARGGAALAAFLLVQLIVGAASRTQLRAYHDLFWRRS